MDFSEIIVTIIISLVIIAINALGSKKKQEVKNQQGERPLQDTESHETTDEPWGETRTLTIDDIFKELRKAKEEAEQEDDYIPKAKKKPQTQILERPAEKTLPGWLARDIVSPEPIIPSTMPEKEGVAVFTHTVPPITSLQHTDYDTAGENPIDVKDIDWRKAVIASEILNRKY